jgi:hypothetical protein
VAELFIIPSSEQEKEVEILVNQILWMKIFVENPALAKPRNV